MLGAFPVGPDSGFDHRRGGAAMPEKLPRIGDRVNLEGREGIFFVLSLDGKKRTVSLLPNDDGRVLSDIPVDTLTALPRPDSNGATRG
jgi:hypothetical protein